MQVGIPSKIAAVSIARGDMSHQRTGGRRALELVAAVATTVGLLVSPLGGSEAVPGQPAAAEPTAPCDVPSKADTGPLGEPFADLQAVAQHFADQLGRLKEQYKTTSPAELAEQAQAERTYTLETLRAPGEKYHAEVVYTRARPGVVVLGGIYKCSKCSRWHAKCAGGFVVGADGLVMTNLHVVEGYKKLEALGGMTDDGRVFAVKAVLASSRLNDLALLKLDAQGLRPLPVSGDVPMGATVYCLSHPAMFGGKSNGFYAFSQGIVCGKFAVRADKQQLLRILAVTTEYGPGSSGGPILDEHGAVVGIVCQAQPVFKSEQDKGAQGAQMVWKSARPACSILDMLTPSSPGSPASQKALNLDSEREPVVAAVDQAHLTYPHLFDGQGWKNSVARLYRVHAIPQIYLLDQQLKIVAKNLRGERLEEQLVELLGPGDTAAAEAVDKALQEEAERAVQANRAKIPSEPDKGPK